MLLIASVSGVAANTPPSPEPRLIELSGILKRPPKSRPRLRLVPAGGTQWFDLGGELLKGIQEDTRLRVKGVVKSHLHPGDTKDNRSPFPAQWVIWLEVIEVEVLDSPLDVLRRQDAHRPHGDDSETGEQNNSPDDICQRLFETYIARRGKINTSSIMAASHIVAERGRNTGFWRTVLEELRKGKEKSEAGCVRVLGKMLSIDAAARDVIRREKETGELSQWKAGVRLGPEVVKELIARGDKADRFLSHYAIALARARVPETMGFFRMILREDRNMNHNPTVNFYAAVGLAQLADAEGMEWLIENSEGRLHTVKCAWPSDVADWNLSTSCVAALRMLSGEGNLSTKLDWEAWWQEVKRDFRPKSHVRIVDSRW